MVRLALPPPAAARGFADPRRGRVRTQLRRAKRRDRQRRPRRAEADSPPDGRHDRRVSAPRLRGEARRARQAATCATPRGRPSRIAFTRRSSACQVVGVSSDARRRKRASGSGFSLGPL